MIFILTVTFATAHCQLAKNQHKQKLPILTTETQNPMAKIRHAVVTVILK